MREPSARIGFARTRGVMTAVACITSLLITSVVSVAPRPACAAADDTGTATQFFRAGSAAFERGENRAAALAFEEAFRRAPRGPTMFNAALAWDAANEPARAADAYAAAILRGDLDASATSKAQHRLQIARRSFGWIEVVGAPGVLVSVAHAKQVPVPAVVHVPPGAHDITVHLARGRTRARQLTVVAGVPSVMKIDAEPEPPSPLNGAALVRAPAPAPESSSRAWGWASLGAGAAAAVVAGVLGTRALAARDDYEASGWTDADARERAASLRLGANVAWAGTVILGGTGAVLLWRSRKDR